MGKLMLGVLLAETIFIATAYYLRRYPIGILPTIAVVACVCEGALILLMYYTPIFGDYTALEAYIILFLWICYGAPIAMGLLLVTLLKNDQFPSEILLTLVCLAMLINGGAFAVNVIRLGAEARTILFSHAYGIYAGYFGLEVLIGFIMIPVSFMLGTFAAFLWRVHPHPSTRR